MATGKPTTTTNNRAAQQAKLRRAKSGKRRAAHKHPANKHTTRKHPANKHTLRNQMGGTPNQLKIGNKLCIVFDNQPSAEDALGSASDGKLAIFKNLMGRYQYIDKSGTKTPLKTNTTNGITELTGYLRPNIINNLVNEFTEIGDEEKQNSPKPQRSQSVKKVRNETIAAKCEIITIRNSDYCVFNTIEDAQNYETTHPLGNEGILIYKQDGNYNYMYGKHSKHKNLAQRPLTVANLENTINQNHNSSIENPNAHANNPFFGQSPSASAHSQHEKQLEAQEQQQKTHSPKRSPKNSPKAPNAQMSEPNEQPRPSIVFPDAGPAETDTEHELDLPQIDKLRASLADLQQKKAEILEEIDTHNASEEEYQKLETELKDLEAEYKRSVEEYNTRHEEHTKEMAKLAEEQKELLTLSKKNMELEAKKRQKSAELKDHQIKLNETKKMLDKLQAEQTKLDAGIAELEKQIKDLEESASAKREEELSAAANSEYENTTGMLDKILFADTDENGIKLFEEQLPTKRNEPPAYYGKIAEDFEKVLNNYCGKETRVDVKITCGVSETNSNKNRYRNIPAYDNTRVKLTGKTAPASDYINANYITLGNRHYIATQGPKDNTIEDFWDMIIQERSNVICMVTGFVEGSNNKCAYYFGAVEKNAKNKSQTQITIGKYTITTILRTIEHNIEERSITISGNGKTHTLTHLWYTAWPDHGVPENTMDLINLSETLDKFTANEDGTPAPPPVVHCSAGVGRTGTIIAINHLLSLNPVPFTKITKETIAGQVMLENTNTLLELMYDDLVSMREQRSTMIQQAPQYNCVFQTVKDFYENPDIQIEYNNHKLSQNAFSNYDDLNPQKAIQAKIAAEQLAYNEEQKRLATGRAAEKLAKDAEHRKKLEQPQQMEELRRIQEEQARIDKEKSNRIIFEDQRNMTESEPEEEEQIYDVGAWEPTMHNTGARAQLLERYSAAQKPHQLLEGAKPTEYENSGQNTYMNTIENRLRTILTNNKPQDNKKHIYLIGIKLNTKLQEYTFYILKYEKRTITIKPEPYIVKATGATTKLKDGTIKIINNSEYPSKPDYKLNAMFKDNTNTKQLNIAVSRDDTYILHELTGSVKGVVNLSDVKYNQTGGNTLKRKSAVVKYTIATRKNIRKHSSATISIKSQRNHNRKITRKH